MEIQNTALKNQIDKWLSINPIYNKIFENYTSLIQIADCNSVYYQFTEKVLTEFIDGLIYSGLYLYYEKKDSEKARWYKEEGNNILKPVFDTILKHAKSEDYQDFIINKQITGKDILEINNVKVPIDLEAIKLHSKRKSKLLLTREHVEEIEKDFVNYKKELYSEPKSDNFNQKIKLSTKLDQPRMKAIHQYLYEENYIENDEPSWLFWFDLQPWLSKKKNPSRIKWNKASYVLTNVVYILCGNMGVKTDTAMKNAFVLPKGRDFQNKTVFNKAKEPYKTILEKMRYGYPYIK